jgi:uncharacterized protein (DUF1697 family)
MSNQASKFLALLRGINVGGKNIIAKDALKQCFEGLGFLGVRTYIQSGNVLFRSDEASAKVLATAIERELSDRFSYDAQVIVFSMRRYKAAVKAAPEGWGTNDSQKHNAAFTLGGASPKRVLAQLPSPKEGVESIATGPGVIFWSVSKTQLTKTTFMKLPSAPIYQRLTIRNHNTVNKLLELFDQI